MNHNEFSEKIKAKYPQYKDMDNRELAQKMVAKYPQYSDVTFDDIEQPKENKGIDLTPSGMTRRLAAATVAPFYGAKTGQGIIDSYKELRNIQEEQLPKNFVEKGLDVASTFALPQAKILQAGKLAPVVNNLATGAYQGGLIGGVQGLQEGKPLEGLTSGAGVGGAVGASLPVVGKLATPIKKTLENPIFQKGFGKVEELLTSVPSEYTERALQQELAGNSIFKGKFNSKDLNSAYNAVGKRAIAGMKNAEYLANQEISNALNSLPANSIDAPQLVLDISNDISNLSKGGRINPALKQKGQDIVEYLQDLGNTENKTVDFHHIKDDIQTKLKNQYGKESGAGINALKGMGAKIRQTLNDISPEYAKANANREALHAIKEDLGGMKKSTIGGNLRNVEGEAKVRAGYNAAAEQLENLVAPEYKFMDEVKDLRAREALEQWFPGQFGGFGTKEGAANLLRGLVGTGAITATHNPLFLAAFSPKISGKGTIQNLGKIYQNLGKEIPEPIRRLMTLGAVNAIPLQGRVEINDTSAF